VSFDVFGSLLVFDEIFESDRTITSLHSSEHIDFFVFWEGLQQAEGVRSLSWSVWTDCTKAYVEDSSRFRRFSLYRALSVLPACGFLIVMWGR